MNQTNVQFVTKELKKRGFQKLFEGYNSLVLSPKKKRLEEQRNRTLKRYRENTVGNLARCAKRP